MARARAPARAAPVRRPLLQSIPRRARFVGRRFARPALRGYAAGTVTTPATAMVSAGLNEGEKVIVDGIQKVRPGIKVAPSPVPASNNGAAK